MNKILKKNEKNLLLEFTATMDFLNPSIREKYKNKVLYRYDLKQLQDQGLIRKRGTTKGVYYEIASL